MYIISHLSRLIFTLVPCYSQPKVDLQCCMKTKMYINQQWKCLFRCKDFVYRVDIVEQSSFDKTKGI